MNDELAETIADAMYKVLSCYHEEHIKEHNAILVLSKNMFLLLDDMVKAIKSLRKRVEKLEKVNKKKARNKNG